MDRPCTSGPLDRIQLQFLGPPDLDMPLGRDTQGLAVEGRQFAATGVADVVDGDGGPLQRSQTGVDGEDPVFDTGRTRGVQSQGGGAAPSFPPDRLRM